MTPIDGALWACHEDTIRTLLPVLDGPALVEVAADLRPGSGGRWEALPGPFEARRALLLADVALAWETATGGPWPIPGDMLGAAPDDVSAIVP